MSSWNDPRNAEIYDTFTRKHPMYRETSRDLVQLAELEMAEIAVDLACGTGVSTDTILERLGDSGRIIALDGSEAMLQIAKRRISDARVRWVKADGSDIAKHVTDANVIICNSAIWQMEMEPTIIACAKALRPGGRLVFNVGRRFLMMPLTPEEMRPINPSLFQLIQAVAVPEHGFALPHPALSRGSRKTWGLLTPESVDRMIAGAGLVLDATERNTTTRPKRN